MLQDVLIQWYLINFNFFFTWNVLGTILVWSLNIKSNYLVMYGKRLKQFCNLAHQIHPNPFFFRWLTKNTINGVFILQDQLHKVFVIRVLSSMKTDNRRGSSRFNILPLYFIRNHKRLHLLPFFYWLMALVFGALILAIHNLPIVRGNAGIIDFLF